MVVVRCNVSHGQVIVTAVVVSVLLTGSAVAVFAAPSTETSTRPAVSAAQADVTQINSCTTITSPGRYVLTTDIIDDRTTRLSESCIQIAANNVIFDGGNHTIDGKGISDTRGIVTNGTNVTVQNVAVSDWNLGIYYVNASGGTIRGVTATKNAFGIALDWSQDVTVADNTASHNLIGINLVRSDDSIELRGNDVAGNHIAGVYRNKSTETSTSRARAVR